MGRWREEVSWGKSERERNHERLDSEKQTEGFGGEEGGWLGKPGGRYYGGHLLHGALGVAHKQ